MIEDYFTKSRRIPSPTPSVTSSKKFYYYKENKSNTIKSNESDLPSIVSSRRKYAKKYIRKRPQSPVYRCEDMTESDIMKRLKAGLDVLCVCGNP